MWRNLLYVNGGVPSFRSKILNKTRSLFTIIQTKKEANSTGWNSPSLSNWMWKLQIFQVKLPWVNGHPSREQSLWTWDNKIGTGMPATGWTGQLCTARHSPDSRGQRAGHLWGYQRQYDHKKNRFRAVNNSSMWAIVCANRQLEFKMASYPFIHVNLRLSRTVVLKLF